MLEHDFCFKSLKRSSIILFEDKTQPLNSAQLRRFTEMFIVCPLKGMMGIFYVNMFSLKRLRAVIRNNLLTSARGAIPTEQPSRKQISQDMKVNILKNTDIQQSSFELPASTVAFQGDRRCNEQHYN